MPHAEQLVLHPRAVFWAVLYRIPRGVWRLIGRKPPRRSCARPRPVRRTPPALQGLGGAPIAAWLARLPRPEPTIGLAPSPDRWLFRRAAPPLRPRKLRAYVARAQRAGARPTSLGGPGGRLRLSGQERQEHGDAMFELAAMGVYETRPLVYGDCEREAGAWESDACPWVSCRMHLYLEVDPVTGQIKQNFPGLDVDEIPETCALRVAERGATEGGYSLEVVGKIMNLTQERVRQIQNDAQQEGHAVTRARRTAEWGAA